MPKAYDSAEHDTKTSATTSVGEEICRRVCVIHSPSQTHQEPKQNSIKSMDCHSDSKDKQTEKLPACIDVCLQKVESDDDDDNNDDKEEKDKDSVSSTWDRRDNAVLVQDDSSATQPGAVAVRGFCFRDSSIEYTDDDDDSGQQLAPSPPPPPCHIDTEAQAYLVDEVNERERLRQEILNTVITAEQVEKDDDTSFPRRWYRLRILCAILLALTVALPVGLVLGLRHGNGNQDDDTFDSSNNDWNDNDTFPAAARDKDVLVSIAFRGNPHTTFLFQGHAELRATAGNQTISSGSISTVHCRVKPCVDTPERCRSFGMFEPSCLDDSHMGNDTQDTGSSSTTLCGNECPPPPDSCAYIGRSPSDCRSSDCYICPFESYGYEQLYLLDDMHIRVDCLHVGNATIEDSSSSSTSRSYYTWAILCGTLVEGSKPEVSLFPGDFLCFAGRQGGGYSDRDGGIATYVLPCALLSFLQCGCAPEGTVIPGIPQLSSFPHTTTTPCTAHETCPFACSDEVPDASSLCRAFPEDIAWWEGNNPIGQNLFIPGMMGWSEYHIDIYVPT